jgi:hypothetical protein
VQIFAIAVSATNRYRKTPFDRSFFLAAHVWGLAALFVRISSKPGWFFGWGTATSKFEFGLAFFF